MDCSVTTRWTKPFGRFLKPAIDEPKLPPQLYWSLKWSNNQHSVDSDTALWAMELPSGRGLWGGLFRSCAAHPPSVCGQPHGWRLPRRSPVGSYQRNRLPLLSGQMPEWSAEQMRQHFPALVGWVVYGALLGTIHQALHDLAEHFYGPELAPKVSAVSVSKRIVILGGGFAGMRTAECLEEKLRTDSSINLTLINETNALLFTPMLAEVAGSSLEPSHISTPLRSTLRRTEFIRGVVADVDLEKRLVILRGGAGAEITSYKPTSRYQSGQFPRSPFVDTFIV